jgi:carboxyl-terminal processing protease
MSRADTFAKTHRSCRGPSRLSRRTFTGAMILGSLAASARGEPVSDTTYIDDFDEAWKTLADRYCYFEQKRTDWQAVRALYRPLAQAAGSPSGLAEIIRLILAELYDPHTHLSSPAKGTPFWPPYDLLVDPERDGARVAAVYEGSAAAVSGVQIGDLITGIGEETINAASRRYFPKCLTGPDPQAQRYAYNVAVGGLRGESRHFTLQRGGKRLQVAVPDKEYPHQPDLETKYLEPGFGYILIRSFGSEDVVAQFDHALEAFSSVKGLLIDVRYNGGGDTAIARPIMGRFIHDRAPYAFMRRRQGPGLSAPWTEYVEPRGPFTFEKPVVIICGHWSASMAEGFPMGMRDIGRATIVGTPMMGLGAGLYNFLLDRTGIRAQYSAEPVYDTHGLPRSDFRPDVTISPTLDAVRAGIAELERICGIR